MPDEPLRPRPEQTAMMNPKRFRALVKAHFADAARDNDAGLSAFARWLPIDPRQARRYALDETPIPPAIARLLEAIEQLKLAPASIPDQNGKVAK
jgi:hypothetical protein